MTRKYTPRRAGRRWLEGAPEYILDCFRQRKEDGGFDVLFTGSLLGTVASEPRDFAHVYVMGLDLAADGRYYSFELSAYQAVQFRRANSHRRMGWKDLPREVRKSIEEWAKD